jgi:methionyl-tRNA formyltransferase
MFAKAVVPIGSDDSSEDVEMVLAAAGAGVLVSTLDALEAGTAVAEPQDERLASYAPRLTKEEGMLDWSLPAAALHNRVRGLRPWPQAFSVLNGTRLVIIRGQVEPDHVEATSETPGTILEAKGERLVVAAGRGTAYRLLDVQPEGRRAMTARDFLAGHRVDAGAQFSAGGGPESKGQP